MRTLLNAIKLWTRLYGTCCKKIGVCIYFVVVFFRKKVAVATSAKTLGPSRLSGFQRLCPVGGGGGGGETTDKESQNKQATSRKAKQNLMKAGIRETAGLIPSYNKTTSTNQDTACVFKPFPPSFLLHFLQIQAKSNHSKQFPPSPLRYQQHPFIELANEREPLAPPLPSTTAAAVRLCLPSSSSLSTSCLPLSHLPLLLFLLRERRRRGPETGHGRRKRR